MGWVSPNDFIDVGSDWIDEGNAYDGNTGTWAQSGTDNAPIELLLPAPIECDKVRHWLTSQTGNWIVEISVYYDGSYHVIFDANPTQGEWVEIGLGGTETVSKVKFEGHTLPGARGQFINEFEFNEIAAPVPYTSINVGDTWQSVTSMAINVADSWQTATSAAINVGDAWQTVIFS